MFDPATRHAAIVDSVLDYDPAAGPTSFASADEIIEFVKAESLKVDWLLETHAHADHLSAAPYLQQKLGGKIAIGKDILRVQEVFGKLFNAGTEFALDGSQFDHLFEDGDTLQDRRARRPWCCTCRAIRRPTSPTSSATRCSPAIRFSCPITAPRGPTFPGAMRTRFTARSAACCRCRARRGCSCATTTRRPVATSTSGKPLSATERAGNVHVHDGVSEDEFVKMRTERDKTLGMPRLILPSVQVNMRAGHFPEPEANGTRYLKIPLNAV